MAGNIIEVNTVALNSAVSSIREEIEALRSEARSVRAAADELGAAWEGPAKEAWTRQILQDADALDKLIDAISRFTEKTDESRETYAQCENRVGGVVASVRV